MTEQDQKAAQNQGEGNREAARHFNDAEKKFVDEGKVDANARDAAKALDGPEAAELEEARKSTAAHAKK